MATQTVSTTEPGARQIAPPPADPKSSGAWWKVVAAIVALGAIVGVAWYLLEGRKPREVAGSVGQQPAHGGAPAGVAVDVLHPKKGGMERVSEMTGSVHPFESANLFANVSGFLKQQELLRVEKPGTEQREPGFKPVLVDGKPVLVDIGTHVEKGQVLAIIDVPELYAAWDQSKAEVEQARAQATQAEAAIKTAKADLKATEAEVSVAQANVGRYTAAREETSKAFNRFKGLRALNSVEQDVVDQRQDAYESAVAAESASRAQVLYADSKVIAAQANVEKAEADLKAAQSKVAVAKATETKAKVLVDYTIIRSPYTGVVTARNYFPGDFIRSASDGNSMPLLNVARTDLMRIRTKISDLEVPYADVGDPAVVSIDAMPGVKLVGKVARFSESEIPNERTMITEIDLPNTKDSPSSGRLREGMYGIARIQLTPPSGHLTVPSSSLVGPAEGDTNALLVLRGDKAAKIKVKVGRDDGREAEIVEGLADKDQVIVPSGSVADGTQVVPNEAMPAIEKEKAETH